MHQRLLVLYGSQTGCAKDVAERIAREGVRRRFVVQCSYMDAYDVRLLPTESLVVFVASTTGQGETPDNMKDCWRFLRRKDIPPGSLAAVDFSVFGLGDSGYPLFNAVARRLYQRLLNLGAVSLVPRALGDDQHPLGYDGALEPWLDELWDAVLKKYPLPDGLDIVGKDVRPAALYKVTIAGEPSSNKPTELQQPKRRRVSSLTRLSAEAAAVPLPSEQVSSLPSFGDATLKYTPFTATLTKIERLTADTHFQDVRHMELNIKGSGLSYQPGDVLLIHPQNPRTETLEFIKAMGFGEPHQRLSIARVEGKQADNEWPPSSCTLAELFQSHLDLFGTPGRYFFEFLSHFAMDQLEKERLIDLASAEFQDDLYRYNQKEKRTYAEVFGDFPSVRPPLAYLLQLIPRLQPRQFSISSSQMAHPEHAHVTVAVVDFVTPYKRRRTGVCTSFLASLAPDKGVVHIPVWVRTGSFRMPQDTRHPIVMVGPGTGIAPFLAMCQQRHHLRQQCLAKGGDAADFGPVRVYFGGRNAKGDNLYAEQWREMEDQGTVTYRTAFSRDQADKVYVQHRLKEDAEEVWKLLGQDNGYFFLAGNRKNMPSDVRKALADIAQSAGGLSEAETDVFFKTLEKQHRYLMEVY